MKAEYKIIADSKLIAYCDLYCGACRSYIKGTCPGCIENEKATWCNIRKCCQQNHYKSCADCKDLPVMECKKFNNFISKIFAFVFNSNREACINKIRESGYEQFANEMSKNRMQSLKRK